MVAGRYTDLRKAVAGLATGRVLHRTSKCNSTLLVQWKGPSIAYKGKSLLLSSSYCIGYSSCRNTLHNFHSLSCKLPVASRQGHTIALLSISHLLSPISQLPKSSIFSPSSPVSFPVRQLYEGCHLVYPPGQSFYVRLSLHLM